MNFLSCDPSNFDRGENVMSIAYMPGARQNSSLGHFYIAWEQGIGSKRSWSPAACNNYILFDLAGMAAL